MWIKENVSREYHVVCNGKTNRPSEKGLFTLSQSRQSASKVTKYETSKGCKPKFQVCPWCT